MAIKRSMMLIYLNTGTSGTPVWSLMGNGITSLNISYNPKTDTQQYINADTATTTTTGLEPNIDLSTYYEATVASGVYTLDAVASYLDNLRHLRKIGTDADAEILMVDLFKASAYDASTGWTGAVAQRQKVNIQPTSFGGDASTPLTYECAIGFSGDPMSNGTAVVSADKKTVTYTAA